MPAKKAASQEVVPVAAKKLPAAGAGDVLDAEPLPDDRPVLTVRGRDFHLRSGVPNALLVRAMKSGRDIAPFADRPPKEWTLKQQEMINEAVINAYDGVLKLVVEDERREFEDYCIDVEPPFTATEHGELLGDAIEAITGHPTGG